MNINTSIICKTKHFSNTASTRTCSSADLRLNYNSEEFKNTSRHSYSLSNRLKHSGYYMYHVLKHTAFPHTVYLRAAVDPQNKQRLFPVNRFVFVMKTKVCVVYGVKYSKVNVYELSVLTDKLGNVHSARHGRVRCAIVLRRQI